MTSPIGLWQSMVLTWWMFGMNTQQLNKILLHQFELLFLWNGPLSVWWCFRIAMLNQWSSLLMTPQIFLWPVVGPPTPRLGNKGIITHKSHKVWIRWIMTALWCFLFKKVLELALQLHVKHCSFVRLWWLNWYPCIPSALSDWHQLWDPNGLGSLGRAARTANPLVRTRTGRNAGLSCLISSTSTKMDALTSLSCGQDWQAGGYPVAPWRR